MVTNDLSAGICDNCIHCGIMHGGNGVDEPLLTVPYCSKTEKEIIPVNEKFKKIRITDCQHFIKITINKTVSN